MRWWVVGLIGLATLHNWRPVYIGRIRGDGQFDAVWSSGKAVRPIPFPPSRPRPRWQDLLDLLYRGWDGWANPGPTGTVSRPATTRGAVPDSPSDPPPDGKRANRSATPARLASPPSVASGSGALPAPRRGAQGR